MRGPMIDREIGSIWTVPDLGDAAAVLLAGPFRASSASQEYLIAPLYTGDEPGNRWTSEDVRLEPAEIGGLGTRYVAIWNARPLLAQDLGLQVGLLAAEAVTAVRDAYWENLNEKRSARDPRLGAPIRSRRERVAKFQGAELRRWEPLSGRVLVAAEHEVAEPNGVSIMYDDAEATKSVLSVSFFPGNDFPRYAWAPVTIAGSDMLEEYVIPAGGDWIYRMNQAIGFLPIAYPQVFRTAWADFEYAFSQEYLYTTNAVYVAATPGQVEPTNARMGPELTTRLVEPELLKIA